MRSGAIFNISCTVAPFQLLFPGWRPDEGPRSGGRAGGIETKDMNQSIIGGYPCHI